MGWFDRLVDEISAGLGQRITAEQLLKEFGEFRKSQADPLLKESYPPDMHHFRRATSPQASTKDIILSFMDHRYRHLAVPMIAELASTLDGPANRRAGASELDRVLVKERIRRFASGPKRGNTYWGINRERIRRKYEGLYALLRIDSAKTFQVEPFAIAIRENDPYIVSAYWACDDRVRVGDLLVNTYRFSGITVCKSTDNVIEPVSISLLRVKRSGSKTRKRPLILGGFAVGWKDNDATALFHCRIALIKLNWNQTVRSSEEFVRAVGTAPVQKILDTLRHNEIVVTNLKPRFLEKPDLAMNAIDATDALPGLGHEPVTITELD